MSYKLVISEKPSVAQSIASVIGAKEKKKGCYIGNDYIVSWCIGHLIELAKTESYDERYSKWKYSDLPIIPKDWKYSVSTDKFQQLNIISELMKREDVDTSINACDSGREGELIFRHVYEYCKCKKPVKRLWISSMEEIAIKDGFNHLHSSNEYDNPYQSALCRAKADWIVGINATRLFSVLYGDTFNVGRVLSPTLALITKREQEITEFIKEPFYIPEIDCKTFKAIGVKKKDKLSAEKIISDCNGKSVFVKEIDRQKKSISCPKLFDLTTLQRESNRFFGYTAQQTLDYAQSLYEKKLITYPRTDSKYLTEDMESGLKSLAKSVCLKISFFNSINPIMNTKQVIDNSKVTDHHALIPTISIANVDTSSLTSGELSILHMVCSFFICSLANNYEYNETTVTLECNKNIFKVKGRTITNQGFKQVYELFKNYYKDKNENISENIELPEIIEGEIFDDVTVTIKECFTSAPKSYTEDTILKAMETAGTKELIEDIERKGLGTSATRAGIIEKLVKTKFIERKGKNLIPTIKGIKLITILPEPLISPLLTSEWENKLKQVEQGKLTSNDFMEKIFSFIHEVITENTMPKEEYKSLFVSNESKVGICPRCKNEVIESSKGFFCENKSCEFAIWKDNIFFKSKKVELTKDIVVTLLKEGRIFMPKLYSKRTDKTYCATIMLDDTGEKYVNFKLEFPRTFLKTLKTCTI